VVISTGKSYTAKVVGTVPTKDVAMIKLQSASGLQTANLGDSSSVSVGDSVTGVGNAGGAGGTPSAATGKVTALNQTITASDEDQSSSERLHGVIVTDAPIQAGDSGGPLYDSANKIIGIDTAASTSGRAAGFAIPINAAMQLVSEIRTGVQTSSVHIGYPGFMGVEMVASTNRAQIQNVISGGPAARAGLESGDVITKVNGTSISTETQLRKTVSAFKPGSQISVSYTDASGSSHSASLTLVPGPAD
jgi:S1-C subfamily serine protease